MVFIKKKKKINNLAKEIFKDAVNLFTGKINLKVNRRKLFKKRI